MWEFLFFMSVNCSLISRNAGFLALFIEVDIPITSVQNSSLRFIEYQRVSSATHFNDIGRCINSIGNSASAQHFIAPAVTSQPSSVYSFTPAKSSTLFWKITAHQITMRTKDSTGAASL